jgi:uncharacterized membrane protein required for colicin V production
MIGFIIESPLAHNNISTTILALFNHINEIVLFNVIQLTIVFSIGNIDRILGFGLGRLEGTGQYTDFSVLDFLSHLRMGDIFVDKNTWNKFSVFQRTTSFSGDLLFL